MTALQTSPSALSDWRGAMLARLRALIRHADPEITENYRDSLTNPPIVFT